MKQFKMIIIKYKISSIIIIFSLIFPIIFFILGITKNYAFLTFAGSILMAGVAFYGFIYDRELNNDKNRRLETNFLKFVSKEVEFNVSQLEKFQSEISILKQQRHDRYVYTKPDIKPQVNITKWGDYTFCFEFIEPEEFNNLLIFYRRLENISEYSCHDIVSKDNIGNEIERIEENIKLGKQIIEYLNK